MIRSSTIKRLFNEVVIHNLKEEFAPLGFKYVKGDQVFKKSNGNFQQVLKVAKDTRPTIDIDHETGDLIFRFQMVASINYPELNKWIEDKLNERAFFNHPLEELHSFMPFDEAMMGREDYYVPSESQQFKQNVFNSIARRNDYHVLSDDELVAYIPTLLDKMTKACDEHYLFENRPPAYRNHLRLMAFIGELELCARMYRDIYLEGVKRVKGELEENEKKGKASLDTLEKLRKEAKILTGIKLESPFTQKLTIAAPQQKRVKLTDKIGFEESLRIDFGLYLLTSYAINDKGTIVALFNKKELKKIDAQGVIEGEWTLDFSIFQNSLYKYDVVWNREADCFILNNYLVGRDNKLMKLEIDLDLEKLKEKLYYEDLADLEYDEDQKKFYTLYNYNGQFLFSQYSSEGKLLQSKILKGYARKINLPKEQIICSGKGNSMDVFSFAGEKLANLKFGNGNDRIALSPDGSKMLLHFYGTKSQYYDMTDYSSKTLWAHPTYISGYVDTFYSDINHNFGLTDAWFSPDGKTVFGTGDHGKYVAWSTDKLSRHELIPKEEYELFYSKQLAGSRRSPIDDEFYDYYFTPYIAHLKGHTFYVNSGHSISDVHFLDDRDLVISVQRSSLLIWNGNFENVGFVEGIGRISVSGNNYIMAEENGSMVIYKRLENIDEDFDSSFFAKMAKTIVESKKPPVENSLPKKEDQINNPSLEKKRSGLLSFIKEWLLEK